MATALRPDRGLPITIGGVTFHFLYTFAVIDDLQTFFDAPMTEVLDRITNDRTFYAAAGRIIEALIRSDLYNNGEENAPTYDQIMHVLTVKDTGRIVQALFKAYSNDMPDRDEDDEPDPDEEVDQINIARLLIIARTELHMSEEEFWKTTPRKYFKLFEEYVALKGGDGKKKAARKRGGGTIDDLP
ncbi:MAG: hypothetical protein IKH75_10175 [Ruminococcus sp.]|nr:hypothetical protein [Ruminococcus sp.]